MGSILSIPVIKFDWKKNMKGQSFDDLARFEEITSIVGIPYYLFSVVLIGITFVIVFSRMPELLFGACLISTWALLQTLFLLWVTLSLIIIPAHTWAKFLRRLLIVGMLCYSLKNEIDENLGKISKHVDEGGKYNLEDRIAIVTGGNSGIGYATVNRLVNLGCDVVMACRNAKKCEKAKSEIYDHSRFSTRKIGKIITKSLDLSDLKSVQSFANEINNEYSHIDYLVNNAGLLPDKGSRTKQGFEMSWGTMHLGHFALTKWLLPLLTTVPDHLTSLLENDDKENDMNEVYKTVQMDAARVVNVASDAKLLGYFHRSLLDLRKEESTFSDFQGEVVDNCGSYGPYDLMPCCPAGACAGGLTNGYARAKLSNVLFAQEFQQRFDEYAAFHGGVESLLKGKKKKGVRRIVSSSLHPGEVQANIMDGMTNNAYMNWFLRSSDDASKIVIYGLMEEFMPSSYIDGMSYARDLFDYNIGKIEVHAETYPAVKDTVYYRRMKRYERYEELAAKGMEVKIEKRSEEEYWSFHKWHWNYRSLLFPAIDEGEACLGDADTQECYDVKSSEYMKREKETVAKNLYDVSMAIVEEYEKDGSLDASQYMKKAMVAMRKNGSNRKYF
jgi:NAD(P)-dependent dehydrogenase (short-subunit alcohol dehydrogenase family)